MSNRESQGTQEDNMSNGSNRNILERLVECLNTIVEIMRQADEREYGYADTASADQLVRPAAPAPDHPRNAAGTAADQPRSKLRA